MWVVGREGVVVVPGKNCSFSGLEGICPVLYLTTVGLGSKNAIRLVFHSTNFFEEGCTSNMGEKLKN